MKPEELLIGLHALEEVARFTPERIRSIFTASAKEARCRALNLNVPIKIVKEAKLTEMAGTESHQGVVVSVTPRKLLSLKEALSFLGEKEHSTVVMMDQIFDPQNVGAILRASECFGVDAVIFSKNRGSAITPVVTKASSGASELVPLVLVSNLADTMQRLQKEGYEAIVSALEDRAENLYTFDCPNKTLLIVGSEGKGVQPLIQKRADHILKIPMHGRVDSLNVSQATAVFLSFLQPQK